MNKINFENSPSTNTPLSAENLNLMQTNIEKAIRGTTLFEVVGGTKDNITLSDSAVNYVRMKFYCHDNDGRYFTCELTSPNGKQINLHNLNYHNDEGFLKQRVVAISNTGIINNDSYEGRIVAKTISAINNIYIDKIVGFKD